MTNPTDTGGENPTIRDVSPPSDTDKRGAGVSLSAVSPDPKVLGCIESRTSRPTTVCIRVVHPEAGQRNSLRSSLCIGLRHSYRAKGRRHRC